MTSSTPARKADRARKTAVKPRGRLPSLALRKQLAEDLCKHFKKVHPDPRCELYYETPFQLLVSVVLSAQTTDKMVNRCMEQPYRKGLGPAEILAMGENKFRELIRSIGLAPTKAKNVLALSKRIHEAYDDQIPETREELEALPGVGRKTANVILGEIFRHPTLAVDTHVFRVGYRLALHRENTPEKAERELLKVIPESCLPEAHHWLILLGRYTCKAQSPDCAHCTVAKLCASRVD